MEKIVKIKPRYTHREELSREFDRIFGKKNAKIILEQQLKKNAKKQSKNSNH